MKQRIIFSISLIRYLNLFQLPNSGNRPESIENELNQSLERLQLSYVDMYLIHVPFSFKEPKETDADGNMILDRSISD